MIDIAILIVVGSLAVLGIRRGFVIGALDLIGVVVGLVVAALYYQRLIDPLEGWGLARRTAAIVAFAGLNVATQIAMSLLTGLLFRPLKRLPWPWLLRWADGLLGLVPGAIKGLAIAAVIVLPLAFLQQPLLLSDHIRSSRLADPLVDLGLDALYEAVDRYQIDLADFAVITSRPTEDGITLPFTVTTGLVIDETAETELLQLVNAERRAAGLDPVELDPALAAVGRRHSEEMFQLGYFAHVSPVTGDPSERLATAKIRYLVSGENLAYAPSVAVAHQGLMESPGHRANILNPRFTRLGIGIIRSERRGLMVSQEFAA